MNIHAVSLGVSRTVSSVDQNTDRQLDGVQLDRTFIDKASGKNTERPALQECLVYLRAGDTLVVHSLDRLGRNLLDLRRLVEDLTKRGVSIQFVKENLTFMPETDSPMATLLLSILGSFAEFERRLILERQKEGIALAKERGAYRGRKPSLNSDQITELRKRVAGGAKKAELAREFNISRETLYTYLRDGATL